MKKYKIDKINSINNEIKELHPILNSLLFKLSNIKKNKMCSDFVLSKIDNTLDAMKYKHC